MTTVSLTEIEGTSEGLEEIVAALFQSSGYFTQKRVEEWGQEDQRLELDVLITDFDSPLPAKHLIEVKGGTDWGYTEIFKIAGWMKYLDVENGALFVTDLPGGRIPLDIETICVSLDINFVHFDGNNQQRVEEFQDRNFGDIIEPDISISLWRFAFWIERELIDTLHDAASEGDTVEAARHAKDYLKNVRHITFHEKDPEDRLNELYSNYSPRLTLGAAQEKAGNDFDPEDPSEESSIIQEAIYDGDHPVIQSCMYVEHKNRLAVLKNMIELIQLDDAGQLRTVEILDEITDGEAPFFLPDSANRGIEQLREKDNFERYPLLWQTFIWIFGGFYLKDRKEEEFRRLSEYTGIPLLK